MIFEATHTHIYPGHRGALSSVSPANGDDCLVAFTDGTSTTGRITRREGRWQLDTAPYRTAAGTAIPAKSWSIEIAGVDGVATFRICGKIVPEQSRP